MLEYLEYKNNLAPENWDIIQWFYNILIDFKKYLRYLKGDNQLRTRKGGIITRYGGIWKIFSIYNHLFTKLKKAKKIATTRPEPSYYQNYINAA